MEEKKLARSPHAREPRNNLLERQARPTRSTSGAPARIAQVVQGDTYQLPDAPLLSREAELSLARDIEALEIEHWCALLSYPPALPSVADAVAAVLPRPCPQLREWADRAAAEPKLKPLGGAARKALATELRELDIERTALRETDARVTSAWQGQPRTQAYLARVASARAAQLRAKGQFVASNLRLVLRMARAYDNSLLDKADLVQEGNIGLMRAVERFDYRRGLRFSTYASWWIRHYLNRAIADKGRLIRVPVHTFETHRRIRQAQRKFIAQHGVEPTLDELMNVTGLPREAIELASQTALALPKSLDRPLGDDGERTLHDVLGDPEPIGVDHGLLRADRAQALTTSLQVLSTFEAAVVRFRFGLDGGEALTLREVGEKYNLSRERIRQVQQAALTKLRVALSRDDNAPAHAVA